MLHLRQTHYVSSFWWWCKNIWKIVRALEIRDWKTHTHMHTCSSNNIAQQIRRNTAHVAGLINKLCFESVKDHSPQKRWNFSFSIYLFHSLALKHTHVVRPFVYTRVQVCVCFCLYDFWAFTDSIWAQTNGLTFIGLTVIHSNESRTDDIYSRSTFTFMFHSILIFIHRFYLPQIVQIHTAHFGRRAICTLLVECRLKIMTG